MGNTLAMVAERILNYMQPYPGDDSYLESGPTLKHHFSVVKVSPEWYYLYDFLVDFDIKIPTHILENRQFCIADWYANCRAHYLDLPKRAWKQKLFRMGETYSDVASCLLRDGISTIFPGESDEWPAEDQFYVKLSLHSNLEYT
ncbi:hypothetical protein BDQ12DRAFT_746857, partial [Crucibulum laeve]